MLTTEEEILINDLVNEYYLEHSKLVNRMLEKLPNREDMQGDFLLRANEVNSVYGRKDD